MNKNKEEKKKSGNAENALKKLDEIVQWFENEEGLDIEEGLVKVREGAELIKDLKKRLAEVENEFREVKKDLE
jgi:exodeoxyribonuclease VII small subunit